MKNNKKGSALVVAMGLVILISILAITILEYIIPFSRNVKGIENSVGAYYNTTSAIENALWFINKNTLGTDSTTTMPTTGKGYKYDIVANGSILPIPGEGNSEFNKDWNRISSLNPIQLEIGSIGSTSSIKLYVRVPDIDGSPTTGAIKESFSGGSIGIIQWQLSSTAGTLNSSGSNIKGTDICDSNSTACSSFNIGTQQGVKLDGSPTGFSTYHINNCSSSNSCILKLSVINDIQWKNGIKSGSLPYLEWKLNLGANTIPLRYTNIKAIGKSYGFTKNLSIKIPQKTTIDAFNFTIFQ